MSFANTSCSFLSTVGTTVAHKFCFLYTSMGMKREEVKTGLYWTSSPLKDLLAFAFHLYTRARSYVVWWFNWGWACDELRNNAEEKIFPFVFGILRIAFQHNVLKEAVVGWHVQSEEEQMLFKRRYHVATRKKKLLIREHHVVQQKGWGKNFWAGSAQK